MNDCAWNGYWSRKEGHINSFYDRIAFLYRKYIIKGSLTHFTNRYFNPGSLLLHAGCGSGQVDNEIRAVFNIKALDFCKPALDLYKKNANIMSGVVQGDIFALPFGRETFDGVYNLGVMEHFTEDDIGRILSEFGRVLKAKGRIVLFWPHRHTPSVIVLNMMRWVLSNIFGRNVKFHPDEITYAASRKQVTGILEKSGLLTIRYYWGWMDLFTHVVVVAEKKTAAS